MHEQSTTRNHSSKRDTSSNSRGSTVFESGSTRPFGKIALIDDPGAFDITLLKAKSLSLHWEFMFARAMHQSTDMMEQSRLLNRVSELVDKGYIQTTTGKNLGLINAANLRAAHAELESGSSIGKIVLQGF